MVRPAQPAAVPVGSVQLVDAELYDYLAARERVRVAHWEDRDGQYRYPRANYEAGLRGEPIVVPWWQLPPWARAGVGGVRRVIVVRAA